MAMLLISFYCDRTFAHVYLPVSEPGDENGEVTRQGDVCCAAPRERERERERVSVGMKESEGVRERAGERESVRKR